MRVRRLGAYLRAARALDPAAYRHKQFAGARLRARRRESPRRRPLLLVGEAAGIDIATGEGIGQAIEYGAGRGGRTWRAPRYRNATRIGSATWRAGP